MPQAPAADAPPPPAAAESDGQWYMSHAQQTTLWSGPDDAAEAFALVPQWSIFRQLAPQQGWRIFVEYFGNSTAQAGVAWVDALNVGPVGPPPDPNHVPEPEWEGLRLELADARAVEAPAEPSPLLPVVEPPIAAEQWYQNHVPQTTLWSGPNEAAVAFAQVPQWS